MCLLPLAGCVVGGPDGSLRFQWGYKRLGGKFIPALKFSDSSVLCGKSLFLHSPGTIKSVNTLPHFSVCISFDLQNKYHGMLVLTNKGWD